MSEAIPAVERLPVELWEQIIVDVLYEELWMHISFTPRNDHTLGFFYSHVKYQPPHDKTLSWDNLSKTPDFTALCAVCRTWKATTERYSYLFRSQTVMDRLDQPSIYHGEVAGLTIDCCDETEDGDSEFLTTLSTWRDQVKESPRLVFLNIIEDYIPAEHPNCSQMENLVAVSDSLRTLKLLRMCVRSKGLGVMKLLSTYFSFLIHLDIRIQVSESETSITDFEHLHMPNLDTLRIRSGRWGLYEASIGSWTLPNLRVLNLVGGKELSPESNPSAQMMKRLFDKFGAKITHTTLMIRRARDKDWLVDWSSIPNIREIVNPRGVYFNGPAPKESKLERIVAWYKDKTRLEKTFDPAFKGRSLIINLASTTWTMDDHNLTIPQTDYERAYNMAIFCKERGWRLENEKGVEWRWDRTVVQTD